MLNDYEQAIEKMGFYIATPIGTSMLPLLRERIDTVKLVAPKDIKKHDVVLYMRDDKTFVLHRIIRVSKKYYTMCGDNQCILERHVKKSQVIAVMDGFYREELYVPKDNKEYLKYVRKHTMSRPFRFMKLAIKKVIRKFLNLFKKKEK